MPFCPKCGYEMKADAKFCYRCGEQIAEQRSAQIQAPFQRNQGTAAAAGAPSFQDYLGKLQARLHINAEYSNTLDAYCFRDSQLNAASALSFTKYHYHFFIRYCNGLEPQSAAAFSEACLEDVWASPHHTSLSLNTFAIPVICMDNGNEAVFRSMDYAFKKKTAFSFSCASYPVILTLNDGQLHYPAHTPLYGVAAYHTVKKMIGDTLYYRW